MPKRIRLSRRKGYKLPEGAVNVARPSKWGNPFKVGVDGTRSQCVRYHKLLVSKGIVTLDKSMGIKSCLEYREFVLAHIEELRGKDLACWCSLDGPCHADNLLLIANVER